MYCRYGVMYHRYKCREKARFFTFSTCVTTYSPGHPPQDPPPSTTPKSLKPHQLVTRANKIDLLSMSEYSYSLFPLPLSKFRSSSFLGLLPWPLDLLFLPLVFPSSSYSCSRKLGSFRREKSDHVTSLLKILQ